LKKTTTLLLMFCLALLSGPAISACSDSNSEDEVEVPWKKPDPRKCEPGDDACGQNASECPPKGPYGHNMGEKLENLEFQGINGGVVELHELCGYNASVIFHFFGWDPKSMGFANKANELYGKYKDDGLAIWLVIAENLQGKPASMQYCNEVRDQYDLNVTVLCDPAAQLSPIGGSSLVIVANDSLAIVYVKAGATFNTIEYAVKNELEE